MQTITLICTTHNEIGNCNAHELLNILLAIGPEVIFEEIRPSDFELAYADKSKYSLEMQAINDYLKTKDARQIPVDNYEIPKSFIIDMHRLDKFVESKSTEYNDAMDNIYQRQSELGFSYLNSSEFISDMKKSELLYREAVYGYGNSLAKIKLAEWEDLFFKRNASMLENIYSFCHRFDFTEGAFIVGAAHKFSIMEGIEQSRQKFPSGIEWRFWNEHA